MASYDHWLPLHIGDYVADTMHLTTLQHGIYLLLIMHYFKHRGLPTDEYALAQIARMRIDHFRRVSKPVLLLFNLTTLGRNQHNPHARWRHKRIDEELERASKSKQKTTSHGQNFNIRGPDPPVEQSRSDRSSSTHVRARASTHSQNQNHTHPLSPSRGTAANAADVRVNGKTHKTKQARGALAVLEILANDKTRH